MSSGELDKLHSEGLPVQEQSLIAHPSHGHYTNTFRIQWILLEMNSLRIQLISVSKNGGAGVHAWCCSRLLSSSGSDPDMGQACQPLNESRNWAACLLRLTSGELAWSAAGGEGTGSPAACRGFQPPLGPLLPGGWQVDFSWLGIWSCGERKGLLSGCWCQEYPRDLG